MRFAVPDALLEAGMCRVYLLVLGKKDEYLPLLHCPHVVVLDMEKNHSLVGLRSPNGFPRGMLLGFRFWGRNCRTGQDTPQLCLRSPQPRKKTCDLVLDRPNLPSFPKAMVSDLDVKESTEETPQKAPSPSPLGGFPRGWGAAIWPHVFNS